MERHTRQRRAIYEAIADAGRPLLAQEVLDKAVLLVPRLSIATVYRNLRCLLDERVIESVLLPGQNPRYELASRAHHHHFLCRQCERVFDLDACPGDLAELAPAGFQVLEHEVVLYGHCNECATDVRA